MRKIFLFFLIVLATGFAQAQRTGSSLTPSSRTSTGAGSRSDNSSSRPSTQQSTSREYGNSTSRNNGNRRPTVVSYGNTNLQPYNPQKANAGENAARTALTRPSQAIDADKSAQTAKTVSAPVKKVSALKPADAVKVNWITIEEALEKSKTEKRKIFIDIYTDWCGWCKHMDSTTYINPTVAAYINEHYYAVKFNAEQTNDVVFNGKTYKFKKEGNRGYHELAALWLNNRFSYPTSVFLDESFNSIQPISGYLDAAKLEAILNYFATNSHRTTPWETYEKKFAASKSGGNGR